MLRERPPVISKAAQARALLVGKHIAHVLPRSTHMCCGRSEMSAHNVRALLRGQRILHLLPKPTGVPDVNVVETCVRCGFTFTRLEARCSYVYGYNYIEPSDEDLNWAHAVLCMPTSAGDLCRSLRRHGQ